MTSATPDRILQSKGIKPTANRILVVKALAASDHPVSLAELDDEISTMYKATIFRVLNLFVEHDIVHTIDDGSGSLKYEICSGESHHSVDDMHVHFFCESCRETICLEDIHIPGVKLPPGYSTRSLNYVIKGICPRCQNCD